MTQSGQGEPAREGIVLPSDGSEPLLPGMTGGAAPQPAANRPAAPSAGPPAATPAGGQAWGRSWGPDQQQTAAPQPGQGWAPAAAQEWGTPDQQHAAWTPQEPSAPGAGPLPPEGAPAPSYGGGSPQEPVYGSGAHGAQHQAYGPGDAAQQPYGGGGAPQQQSYAAPLPPAVDHASPYIPSPAVPASVDEGATQYIPPVAAGGPAPAPLDEGATQYIPPVASGALPPEASGEDTRFLGRAAQPQPVAPHPDAEATQYIAPVTAPYGGAPGGDRQPPAEFDNLFRSAAGDPGPAPATQLLPPVQQQSQDPYPGQPQPAYAPQGPGGGRRGGQDGGGRGRGGRTGSRVPLIAAAGVGIIVLGFGAGALLSGGGDDQSDHNKTVAASAPAEEESPSPSADPVEQQAVALDKLLADSGSSRASVIKAVSDVKTCQNLDQAASDLRDAAKQRTELVTRLSELTVDKLPNHAELTTALTKAWHASASADDHYAAWADQTAGKHGCKKGQARTTGQTQAGNRDSGTASAEKAKAAPLWNGIAKTYGLTERQPTQL
ncbi:hypothetical protein ABZ922_07395 [Streptomyces shenzhenensis]|uniref:hypothetical protein n=1 Tax=Streptomyces shenzhenensis TaxID=943815 RepID=UPI0033D3BF73